MKDIESIDPEYYGSLVSWITFNISWGEKNCHKVDCFVLPYNCISIVFPKKIIFFLDLFIFAQKVKNVGICKDSKLKGDWNF